MRVRQFIYSLLALSLLSGCATKSYVVLLENPDGSTGKVIIKGNKGEQVLSSAKHSVLLDGSSSARPVQEAQLKADFAEAMQAQPKLPKHYLLYFQTGANLTAASESLIPQIIAEAADRSAVDISVIGHTDTMGNPEINEALALERAKTTADLLKSKGLKVHALSIESHGERNLLIPTADNTLEPKNRRVEVSIR